MPNKEERVVIDCLIKQGFGEVKFEPDGNVPPDILLNSSVAIEVRRLNQNQIMPNFYRGLEEVEYPFLRLLNQVLAEASDEVYEYSAVIGCLFERPLPEKRFIKDELKKILEEHKFCIQENREYKIGNSISLRFKPSYHKLRKQFQLSITSDVDSGGPVVSLIYDNLKLIIKEKEDKVKQYRDKYPEWWLAVVDNIGYGLTDLDIEHFYELPKLQYQFDRLLLVSPLEPSNFVYLYEK